MAKLLWWSVSNKSTPVPCLVCTHKWGQKCEAHGVITLRCAIYTSCFILLIQNFLLRNPKRLTHEASTCMMKLKRIAIFFYYILVVYQLWLLNSLDVSSQQRSREDRILNCCNNVSSHVLHKRKPKTVNSAWRLTSNIGSCGIDVRNPITAKKPLKFFYNLQVRVSQDIKLRGDGR